MEEINSTINSPAPTVQPVPSVTESHSSFKIPWVAVFVVGMMVLSSLVTYFILKSPAPVKTSVPAVQTSPQVIVPTPTPDPTANWKTYINSTLGLEFKYPASWFITEITRLDRGTRIDVLNQKKENLIAFNEDLSGIGCEGLIDKSTPNVFQVGTQTLKWSDFCGTKHYFFQILTSTNKTLKLEIYFAGKPEENLARELLKSVKNVTIVDKNIPD